MRKGKAMSDTKAKQLAEWWSGVNDEGPPWQQLEGGLDRWSREEGRPPEVEAIRVYVERVRVKRWGAVYLMLQDLVAEEKKLQEIEENN